MIDLGLLRSKIINNAYDGLFTDPAFQGVFKKHGDLVAIQGGGQPPKSKFSTTPRPGFIRLYQIRDYGDSPQPVYIDERECSKKTKKGDILLARYGASLGKVFLAEEGAYNVALAKVIPKVSEKHLDKKYLYYFYFSHWYRDKIFSISRSAQNGFNKEELNDIEFPLPPLEEQKRIVAKIEELFAKIDEIDKAQKELKELAELAEKKVLDMAVRGELVEQDESEGSGYDFLSYVSDIKSNFKSNRLLPKDKPISEIPFVIPSTWAWSRIGNLSLRIGAGTTPKGGKQNNAYVLEGIPFVREQNVQKDGLSKQGLVFIDSVTDNKMKGSRFFPGDILLNITGGSIGRNAVVTDDFGAGNVNQHVLIIRPADLSFSPFLNKFLYSPVAYNQMFDGIVGDKPALSASRVADFKIPIPPLKEQKRIVSKVACIESQIRKIAD